MNKIFLWLLPIVVLKIFLWFLPFRSALLSPSTFQVQSKHNFILHLNVNNQKVCSSKSLMMVIIVIMMMMMMKTKKSMMKMIMISV